MSFFFFYFFNDGKKKKPIELDRQWLYITAVQSYHVERRQNYFMNATFILFSMSQVFVLANKVLAIELFTVEKINFKS